MEVGELHAKAVIAAALITSGAVEIPTIPARGDWTRDDAGLRLRDLTDYLFQIIASARTEPN